MAANNGSIKLVAGNSNRVLSEAVGAYLQTPLAKADVRRFADMEIFVEIQENVRGSDVFVIQSTSFPTNDHLMELLIIMDALRRSSARRITAVIPYFGYARQDRRASGRTPISSSCFSRWLKSVRDISGTPRCRSLKCVLPSSNSRSTSGVQRSAKTSAPLATGQN